MNDWDVYDCERGRVTVRPKDAELSTVAPLHAHMADLIDAAWSVDAESDLGGEVVTDAHGRVSFRTSGDLCYCALTYSAPGDRTLTIREDIDGETSVYLDGERAEVIEDATGGTIDERVFAEFLCLDASLQGNIPDADFTRRETVAEWVRGRIANGAEFRLDLMNRISNEWRVLFAPRTAWSVHDAKDRPRRDPLRRLTTEEAVERVTRSLLWNSVEEHAGNCTFVIASTGE